MGASSRFGTGGAMTLSPEGNRKTQLPFRVVPTTMAESAPTRSGGSGRATEDLATRGRRDFVFVLEPGDLSRFLTCSEELAGSSPAVVVGEESLAAVAV